MKSNAYYEMYNNELTHAWYLATRNNMIRAIEKNIRKTAKILDAGSGTGGTIIKLKEAGYKTILGIDNNKVAIDLSRKRGIKNVSYGSVNRLRFKEGTFDAVICLDVLYHKGVDYKKAVGEFRRVLKKGGTLYIQEPSYQWLVGKHDRAIETQKRFSGSEILDLLKSAGFKNIRLTHFNMILLPIIILKRWTQKHTNDKRSDVYKLSPLVNNLTLKILEFETHLLSVMNLPLGLSIIAISKK